MTKKDNRRKNIAKQSIENKNNNKLQRWMSYCTL